MSSPKKEKVTCPACKTLIDRWCWRTIDLRRHPEAYEKLKTGAYFKTLCPSCGRAVYEEYSMVCYDNRAGAFIQFVAGTDIEPFFYLDELLEEGQRLSKVNDREDFAELVSLYITNTADQWEEWMVEAAEGDNDGKTGRELIEAKLDIVRAYMQTQWNIDLDDMRAEIQKRQNDVISGKVDLSDLTIK